jgi:hypothetical protein
VEDMTTEGSATAFHDGNYDHNGGDLHCGHDEKRVTVSRAHHRSDHNHMNWNLTPWISCKLQWTKLRFSS